MTQHLLNNIDNMHISYSIFWLYNSIFFFILANNNDESKAVRFYFSGSFEVGSSVCDT